MEGVKFKSRRIWKKDNNLNIQNQINLKNPQSDKIKLFKR